MAALPVSAIVGTEPIDKRGGASAWKSGGAHRGDTKNRSEAKQCNNCGVYGHIAKACRAPRSNQANGKLEEAMKVAHDQAAGNAIAAKEAIDGLREAEEVLREKERRLKAAEDELDTRKVSTSAAVRELISSLDFRIDEVEKEEEVEGWAYFLAKWTLLVSIPLGLAWIEEYFIMCALLLLYLIAWAVCTAVMAVYSWWRPPSPDLVGKRFLFKRLLEVNDHPDLRPDANSLQKLKHADPLLAEITIEREAEEETKTVVVSMEFLAQLTAPKFMTWTSDAEVVFARMVRAAETYQLVNFNRYDTVKGRSIPMTTAVVAWALWKRQQQEGLLDFVGAPRL